MNEKHFIDDLANKNHLIERPGYFVRSDIKESIEKIENKLNKKVVGIIYDGTYNIEFLFNATEKE
mgnify:CR=1 FL=1|tara:strand:- start:217 stop:411 length:195 start_codon:yes stop_codon:yes gene_type:complete